MAQQLTAFAQICFELFWCDLFAFSAISLLTQLCTFTNFTSHQFERAYAFIRTQSLKFQAASLLFLARTHITIYLFTFFQCYFGCLAVCQSHSRDSALGSRLWRNENTAVDFCVIECLWNCRATAEITIYNYKFPETNKNAQKQKENSVECN